MDQLLLRAVAAEAAARLLEQKVRRVSHLGRLRYLLRFDTDARDTLLISIRPDLPRFHLLRGGGRSREGDPREEPHDRFAALLDGEIGGGVLIALDTRPWDRVVEMRFRLPRHHDATAERIVVVELLGRSADILVLDPARAILGSCRGIHSEFRTPLVGAPYLPPPGREAYEGLPVGPEALPLDRDRFADAAAFLEPLSPILARDLREEAKERGAAAAEERLLEILEAARGGVWAPTLYSSRPLSGLTEGERVGRDDLVVAPLPLRAPRGVAGAERIAIPFDSPSEAAATAFGLLERLRDFEALADHHRSLVRKEAGRLRTLVGKLEAELDQAGQSDRLRRLGEALLAGLAVAKVEGATARVADPYDPTGPPLEVPIDPALALPENAQALFARYKKAKRGAAMIATRLEAARGRLGAWERLLGQAETVRGREDLERLREAMDRLGLVHAPRGRKETALPRPAEPAARVRRHTSPDGLVILVGKSGEENDTLTFRVASPWDFWLHAAGVAGAHVVVRNPQRLKSIPEATLRSAAEIAAYYSGARGDGKVEVHYTQRKHVHKRKGMPRGQVLLRRFRAIQVTPRLPVSPIGEV